MANIESVRSGADKLLSALVFILATVFFVACFSLPPSSALLPRWVALFTAVLELPLMARMWREKTVESDEKIAVPVYTSILVLVAYYVAMVLVGYILGTLAYVIAVSRLIGLKNWVALIALAVIITASTYYLFAVFFAVPLPPGMLFQNLF